MKKHEMIDLQLFADASAALNNTTSTSGMTAEMKTTPCITYLAVIRITIFRHQCIRQTRVAS